MGFMPFFFFPLCKERVETKALSWGSRLFNFGKFGAHFWTACALTQCFSGTKMDRQNILMPWLHLCKCDIHWQVFREQFFLVVPKPGPPGLEVQPRMPPRWAADTLRGVDCGESPRLAGVGRQPESQRVLNPTSAAKEHCSQVLILFWRGTQCSWCRHLG